MRSQVVILTQLCQIFKCSSVYNQLILPLKSFHRDICQQIHTVSQSKNIQKSKILCSQRNSYMNFSVLNLCPVPRSAELPTSSVPSSYTNFSYFGSVKNRTLVSNGKSTILQPSAHFHGHWQYFRHIFHSQLCKDRSLFEAVLCNLFTLFYT